MCTLRTHTHASHITSCTDCRCFGEVTLNFSFSETKMRKHVIVVGGGVSGLSAANVLCQSGQFDVTILEAEKRLGGRIHSIDFHGENIELGAQWIHGCEGNEVYEVRFR